MTNITFRASCDAKNLTSHQLYVISLQPGCWWKLISYQKDEDKLREVRCWLAGWGQSNNNSKELFQHGNALWYQQMIVAFCSRSIAESMHCQWAFGEYFQRVLIKCEVMWNQSYRYYSWVTVSGSRLAGNSVEFALRGDISKMSKLFWKAQNKNNTAKKATHNKIVWGRLVLNLKFIKIFLF